jgi:hypothetical protein
MTPRRNLTRNPKIKRLTRRTPRNDPLLQAIKEKARKAEPMIADRTIRNRIQKFREENKIIYKRMGIFAYAIVKYKIDVQRFLEQEGLGAKDLQSLVRSISTSPEKPREIKKEFRQRPMAKRIPNATGLPCNLKNEAERMTEAYLSMYVFENLVRHTVMGVLEKKYSKDWWNNSRVVSQEIKKHVEERKREEKQNKWHSIRGNHDIYYTNFGDLNRIISTNINDFKSIFGGLEIQSEMRQLEKSRNIIAHNNPLPKREIKRIQIYYEDLLKQLGLFAEEQTDQTTQPK